MSKPLARATAALLGQNPMGEDEATTAAGPLELGDDAALAFQLRPTRGRWTGRSRDPDGKCPPCQWE